MMTEDDLMSLMLRQDEKVGNYKETQRKDMFLKRLNRLSKFTEVTQAVIKELQDRNIKFTLAELIYTKSMWCHITTDIYLPELNVIIRQVDCSDPKEVDKGQKYYFYNKGAFYPFFIRSTETKDFVLEKLNNLLEKAMQHPKKGYKDVHFIPRKRKRISGVRAVKVEPRSKNMKINK